MILQMNKPTFLLVLFSILTHSFTWHPLPAKGFEVNKINETLWWTSWWFMDINQTENFYSCYQHQFHVSKPSNQGYIELDWHQKWIFQDQNQTSDNLLKIGDLTHNQAEWSSEVTNNDYFVVDYDPIDYSWFVIGQNYYNMILWLSNNQNWVPSETLQTSVVELLKAEGYELNPEFYYALNNSNCIPWTGKI